MKQVVSGSHHLVTRFCRCKNLLRIGNGLGQHLAWFGLLFWGLGSSLVWAESGKDHVSRPLRFAVTPAIVHDQFQLLRDWQTYLSQRLGRPVQIVSRDRYGDALDLLKSRQVDFAWVSDYPYILVRPQVKLLAVPVYQGKPAYAAYFIVPASDQRTTAISQLQGTVFAYADPISHTGNLIPRYELIKAGQDPNLFFRKTFFTWSHRGVVEAVANAVADGGYVDGYVWDCLEKLQPQLTRQTRIVSKSAEFPFPPIVAHDKLAPEELAAMQTALFSMDKTPAGRQLLRTLNLDGFGPGLPAAYDGVAAIARVVVRQ